MKRKYQTSLFNDVCEQSYSGPTRVKLFNSSKNSLSLVQRMSLLKNLPVHNGCVNSISWNETGEYILSGSDDQHIVVTHGYTYKVLTDFKTTHRANIFSAKFMPGGRDNQIVSCAGDGIILYTDLNRQSETSRNHFNCHSGTTYEVITVPNDPHSFLSCGEDGTVRWFDLRQKNKCTKPECKEDILISCQRAVTTLSINAMAPYQLAIGCSDSRVRLFDRRMLGTPASGNAAGRESLRPVCAFTAPKLEGQAYRITSLNFSPEGEELLVSFSSDHLYLFNIMDQGTTQLSTKDPLDSDAGDDKNKHPSPPVRRLRLRGDWSDTGPDARPEREGGRTRENTSEISQPRATLHATLMQRMTDVLSRMLNDPATRAALNGTGDNAITTEEERQTLNLPRRQISPSLEGDALPSDANLAPVNGVVVPPVDSRVPPAENIPPAGADAVRTDQDTVPPNGTIPPEIEESPPPGIPFGGPVDDNDSSEDSFFASPAARHQLNRQRFIVTEPSRSAGVETSSADRSMDVEQTSDESDPFDDFELADFSQPSEPDPAPRSPAQQSWLLVRRHLATRQTVRTNGKPLMRPVGGLSLPSGCANFKTIHIDFALETLSQNVVDYRRLREFVDDPVGFSMRPVPTFCFSLDEDDSGEEITRRWKRPVERNDSAACYSPTDYRPTVCLESQGASTSGVRNVPGVNEEDVRSNNETDNNYVPAEACSNATERVGSETDTKLAEWQVMPLTGELTNPETVPNQEVNTGTYTVLKTGYERNISIPGPSAEPPRSDYCDRNIELGYPTKSPQNEANDSKNDYNVPLAGTSREPTESNCQNRNDYSAHAMKSEENKRWESSVDFTFSIPGPSCVKTENNSRGGNAVEPALAAESTERLASVTSENTFVSIPGPSSEPSCSSRPGPSTEPRTEPSLVGSLNGVSNVATEEAAAQGLVSQSTQTVQGQASSSQAEPVVVPSVVPSASVEPDYDSDDDNDGWLGDGDILPARFLSTIDSRSMASNKRAQEALFEDQCCYLQPALRQTYVGHRNARTMIKEACFWGTDYVMSGSDCGHVFVWDRATARLVALLPGDQHVVNCLQPHPTLPVLATSGIDYDVKLWAPLAEDGEFDEEAAENLMKRNAVMLEETKDTITVPASFMIRMLACLNQIRRGGRTRGSRRDQAEQ